MPQTTLIVPNLHCPTCTSHIEEALYHLTPPATSVSTSIISHAVTVQHPQTLTVEKLVTALDESGFEVFDVSGDSSSNTHSKVRYNQAGEDRGVPPFAFEEALWRWRPHTLQPEDEKSRKHMENCELCRSQKTEGAEENSDGFPQLLASDKKLPFVTSESTSTTEKMFEADVAIEGMTCSSCVGSVTRALEGQPYVKSANVSLLTHSATVKFYGDHHSKDLIDAVEDIGFGAVLDRLEAAEPEDPKPVVGNMDLWKANYAIGGMTCSSCVSSISNSLKNYSWIKDSEVKLITNNAIIIFEGKNHLEEITEIIEDLGYEANLDTMINLGVKARTTESRKVAIRVSGMYCQHCPPRVEDAIKQIGSISVDKYPSLADPIIEISYVPQLPSLTIRHVIGAINAADEAFVANIHHPMTLEERSRRMQTREQKHLLYRVVLSFIAAIPTFIIGIVYMSLVPKENRGSKYLSETLDGVSRSEWALFTISTPVYFFAADVFHRRAWKELRALWRPGSPTPILKRFYRFGSMNMLISFGTTIAYFASTVELIITAANSTNMGMNSVPTYFDSVVFLTMFLLVGRLLEAYTKAKTGDAVAELGKLRPAEALLLDDMTENRTTRPSQHSVAIDLLEAGDVVRVLHGASPPSDGFIVDGESKFDESSLTGESKPVKKNIGDEVYAGTINKESPVSVRINGVCGTSMLDQVVKIVREGQARRAPVERIADVLTGYFVPLITLIAVTTWVVWMALGLSGSLPENYLDVDFGGWPFWSLEFAIAVFVVACPCGIGLAAPTALFVGGGLAAKHGILAKGGGEAFQEASALDCVVFDKTGTLTHGGDPKITDHIIVAVEEGHERESQILGIVQCLESESTHPIARALVAFSEETGIRKITFENVNEISGKGMEGRFSTESTGIEGAIIGNESLISDFGVENFDEINPTLEKWKNEGKSIALLALKESSADNWRLHAAFAISDPLRSEAASVIQNLQARNIDVWMLSGDNPTTAHAVGSQVGIPRENVIAGVLPSQKAEKVKQLQQSAATKRSNKASNRASIRNKPLKKERAIVAMVGDGINDSAALTAADVGIAIGSGSDVAISSAEFVLLSSNLAALLTLVDLSRVVFRRIKFNFGWALIYNCLAVPLAAGVFYPVRVGGGNGNHIRLDPVWAALAMALSSISVVCSSLLLRTRLPLVGFRASTIRE